MKLHLGCGRTKLDGYTNIDVVEIPDVTDLVCDLDGKALADLLEPDSVNESVGAHFLEHLTDPLAAMEALWTVTKPGGTASFEVPYGSSDDAWEDPTHRRPYFLNSWIYFSQAAYWRADYGYRGDWRVKEITLVVEKARWDSRPNHVVMAAVMAERNVVQAMRATLEAVKPLRDPTVAQDPQPALNFVGF